MICLRVLSKVRPNPWPRLADRCPQWSCLQAVSRRPTHNESRLDLDLKPEHSANQLIYAGPDNMVRLIKMIKKFSLSTTLIAAGVQPFIFQQIMATNATALAVGFAGMTSAGVVLSPLLLNWITKRYVCDLHYNHESQVFTASVLNLWCRRVSVQYSASDVTIPETLGIFTTFTVGPKRQPLFVDPEFVKDLSIYKKMLGYDKPLDLKFTDVLNDDQNHRSEDKVK